MLSLTSQDLKSPANLFRRCCILVELYWRIGHTELSNPQCFQTISRKKRWGGKISFQKEEAMEYSTKKYMLHVCIFLNELTYLGDVSSQAPYLFTLFPDDCLPQWLGLRKKKSTVSAAITRSPLSIIWLITHPLLFVWIVLVSQLDTLLALFLLLQFPIAGSDYFILCYSSWLSPLSLSLSVKLRDW